MTSYYASERWRGHVPETEIIVRSEQDLTNPRSDVIYFLDGIIILTTPIKVPQGGISISGGNFNISGLSNPTGAIFTNPDVGYAGDIVCIRMGLVNTPLVFDSVDNQNNSGAIEMTEVNFFNVANMGELLNYRQGLMNGAGFFNIGQGLTLSGVMSGWATLTSIYGEFGTNITGALFREGTGLTMSGRFRTDMNVLSLNNVGASVCDFRPENILNDGSFVINGALFPQGSNPFPNIPSSSVKANYENNTNLQDTHAFSKMSVSVVGDEVTTSITQNTWTKLEGVFTQSDQVHFDMLVDTEGSKARYLSSQDKTFLMFVNMQLRSGSGDELEMRVAIYDDLANGGSGTISYKLPQSRVVQNYPQSDDRALFNFLEVVNIKASDTVWIEVRNISGNGDITAVAGSGFTLSET